MPTPKLRRKRSTCSLLLVVWPLINMQSSPLLLSGYMAPSPDYRTVEELTEICERQAAIIRRLYAALAQLGAMIDEDDRAYCGLLEEE